MTKSRLDAFSDDLLFVLISILWIIPDKNIEKALKDL
jgi:hypothetical protein